MSTTTDTGKVGKWIDDLKPLLRPITGLEADPHNPRRHDERQIAAIMKMLERWGQHRPATVRGNIVVIGNAMVEAARRLSWTHVAVIRDIVDGRQDSDAESLGRKIADNRAPEIGGSWDKRVLAEEFVAADTGEFQIDDVGFTFEEREAIVTYEKDLNAATGMPNLTDSGDPDFETMTFSLTKIQADCVRSAIDAIISTGESQETGNKNRNGNALARIAYAYLAGVQ